MIGRSQLMRLDEHTIAIEHAFQGWQVQVLVGAEYRADWSPRGLEGFTSKFLLFPLGSDDADPLCRVWWPDGKPSVCFFSPGFVSVAGKCITVGLLNDQPAFTALDVDTYLLHDANSRAFKIGLSRKSRVRRRQQENQTGNPNRLRLLGTIPGNHETDLHLALRRWCCGGEWFRESPQTWEFLHRFAAEVA